MQNDALTAGLDIVDEAKQLFKEMMTAESMNRREQEKDMQFVVGEQWDADEMQERQNNARPCFTVNRIMPFLRVISNEQRENMPAIEVSPNGDGAEVETAEVIANLIRGIEQDSNAVSAYANASFYQTAIGTGYFRISSRYIDEASFDQDLVIKPIDNPFTVLYDQHSVEPDGKDADVCLVVKEMSPYEYKNKFGNSKLAAHFDGRDVSDFPIDLGWANDNTVRVVEYWKRVYVPKTIYQVETVDAATGAIVSVDTSETKPSEAELDVEYAIDRLKRAEPGEPVIYKRIRATRKTQDMKVMQYLVNGHEVLDETEWPGRFIPIIPVRGDFLYANGQRYVQGMVRAMRDPQKIYNLQANLQIETIALAPKAPFIGYAGQFENFEDMWEQANTANLAFLPVNPYMVNGQMAPLPQRMNAEPAIQAVAMTRASFAEDMKAVTGVFDASLGNAPGEESGKAILARQQQTSTSNYQYTANLKRAIKQCGRILVDIIPHFYDTERMVKIVKPSGETEMIAVNKYHDSPVLGDLNQKKHDLTVGKYDVIVSTGKSYATKRQEAVDSMMELARAAPEKLPLYMDLIVKEMDWPGAQLISKRLRADLEMNMPGFLDATGETGESSGDQKMDAMVKVAQATKKAQQLEQGMTQAIEIAERLKSEIADLKQDNQNLRTKSEVDLYRAQLDAEIKQKTLEMEEQKAIQEALKIKLDYQIKLMQLEQEKAKTSVSAINAASKIAGEMHDREMDMQDRMKDDDDDEPEMMEIEI